MFQLHDLSFPNPNHTPFQNSLTKGKPLRAIKDPTEHLTSWYYRSTMTIPRNILRMYPLANIHTEECRNHIRMNMMQRERINVPGVRVETAMLEFIQSIDIFNYTVAAIMIDVVRHAQDTHAFCEKEFWNTVVTLMQDAAKKLKKDVEDFEEIAATALDISRYLNLHEAGSIW